MNLSNIIIACICSIILCIILLIYIAKYPHQRTKLLKIIFFAMFIVGMILYCSCNYLVLENAAQESPEKLNSELIWVKSENASLFYIPYVITKSVLDVGRMFSGYPNGDAFYSLPISRNPVAVLVFWLINLIAFYTTATALIARFGNDLLRWVRLRWCRHKILSHINTQQIWTDAL